MLLSDGQYNNTTRVLSRCTLYAYAILNDSLHFCSADADTLAFKILCDKSVRRFVGKRTKRSCAEHVLCAEKLLSIFMHTPLNVT